MRLRELMADVFGFESPDWIPHLAAGVITLTSIMLVGLLWRKLGAIQDPGLLLLLTVAVSTYLAGGMAGMLSAAIVLFCSFVLFSHPVYPFRYSEMDWRQMMVIIIASPLIALMVGSLKEQVDQLKIATEENEWMRSEIRRLEGFKDAQHLCEERFRLITDAIRDYAVCTLNANGMVMNWNPGAERLHGYSDPEIVGQSYSRFFTKEEILARRPERLLDMARFAGRVEEEGPRVRKGGNRFRATVTIVPLRSAAGTQVGYLMITRDLKEPPQSREPGVEPA